MEIKDLISLMENRKQKVEALRVIAVNEGNISVVNDLDGELTELNITIERLKSVG